MKTAKFNYWLLLSFAY